MESRELFVMRMKSEKYNWGNWKSQGVIRFYIDEDVFVDKRRYCDLYYFRRRIKEFQKKVGETWDRHYMIVNPISVEDLKPSAT